MRIPLLSRLRRDRARAAAFRHLVTRADRARDERRHVDAATLYAEAIALRPARGDLLVQLGNMLKEAGDHVGAEHAYDDAARRLPADADLALQRGHLLKRTGSLQKAREAYHAAQALDPGRSDAAREIEAMDRDAATKKGAAPAYPLAPGDPFPLDLDRLAPELAPIPPEDRRRTCQPGVHPRSLGRREQGAWGLRRTLRGVSAIRGICFSSQPIVTVQLLLDDVAICAGMVEGGVLVEPGSGRTRLRKFAFNLWHDFSATPAGFYEAELRCLDAEGRALSFREGIVVAAPLRERDHPGSDGIVDPGDGLPDLERAIRARPSIVRPARRRLLPDVPRNVLVMRTDQLGDLISSIAAIRRLRELLPQARLVALLTAANADLGRTLGLFDEVIAIDFPDDPAERRRIMPLAGQDALRRQLASHRFDIAIDLAEAGVSRPLLRLSGAPFLYGVGGEDWPWLTAGFHLDTHDRASGMDIIPHSAKTLALVEGLGAMLRQSFTTIPRDDPDPALLRRLGFDRRSFVILHMGARIAFSRWPHFQALAAMILARTDRTVVLMTEDPSIRPSLPPELAADPRFRLIDERLSFDDFDTLVSLADMLVGNDSGPKHLAALRGTPVVTIFSARINWREWGQEEVGTIISRRVPCAGCAIYHDADECAKGFACIADIRVDEVFAAMKLEPAA